MQISTKPPLSELDWFAGNKDALDVYRRLSFIAHAWDDLIDKDKAVDVNSLMANLLIYLPGNPFYRRYEPDLRGIFLGAMASYMAANIMEKSGDAHKVELAHFLRYAIVNAGAYMITVTNGLERGAEILVEALPAMVPERLADYMKEHLNADQVQV
ncbi:hypothetical protein B9Z51_08605 [Limnohabitans sp. T6-5]|uniref:hypothetical protein n=1 Tax=Limnohabitans sp. T6-5 TaxID=1100724 RepID=UPI000D39A7F3|nr:hypothetical protein [Limnohabitans sp. T6-5]PUE08984.1 hypothetical protein B9Z51_08605 [Limnohabitans sp. T6-5]